MEIVSRLTNVADSDQVRDLRLKMLKENPGVFSSSYAREAAYEDQRWRDLATPDKDHAVIGMFSGTQLAGMMAVFRWRDDPAGETAFLGMLYIDPGFQGRGLSERLFNDSIEWAAANGTFKKIVISHRASNEASRRANQKAGFIYTHTQKDVSWPDGSREDEMWYARPLLPHAPPSP